MRCILYGVVLVAVLRFCTPNRTSLPELAFSFLLGLWRINAVVVFDKHRLQLQARLEERGLADTCNVRLGDVVKMGGHSCKLVRRIMLRNKRQTTSPLGSASLAFGYRLE